MVGGITFHCVKHSSFKSLEKAAGAVPMVNMLGFLVLLCSSAH